ncbi:MAG TPA: cobalamin B12-binding domain-containing protein, partial [bacterium]|nr:cobalamin B12-binding domain-containing protein [bacterium]
MKILLLSPPFVKEYMRNARCDFVSLSATQWFPLWLGYCGCYLEKSNRSVKIIDAPAYGLSHNQTESIIEEYKPDAILVYSGNKSEDNDIVFAERIYNKLQVPVIFAGPFFSINPKRTLAKSNVLKYGIYGEFEKPFSEFIESGEPATIKNFVWKDESGEIIINEQRPYLDSKTLDEFPFVSDFFYRNLDYKYYRTPSEPHPFTDIMSGRGCVWGQCSYCLWVHCFIKGKTYN